MGKLKTLLGEHIASTERYTLNWAGKSNAYHTLQQPTNHTLKPCKDESVDFDNTQNIFIESDNLQALKILQKSYAGKIKMIYIDPPYNTGNDFIYHDDFKQNRTDYEIATGDRDINGQLLKSFKKNSKDNGHYHSNWLSIMLPRLHLARTLLADDGVIFISIDDNEQAQLKLLCDEVFGGENFISKITIQGTANESNEGILIQSVTDYCFCYGKNKDFSIINKIDATNEEYRSLNDAPSGLSSRKTMGYTIYYNPKTNDIIPKIDYDINGDFSDLENIYKDDMVLIEKGYEPIRPNPRNNIAWRWRWGMETFLERINELQIRKNRNGKYMVEFKQSGFNAPRNYQEFSTGTVLLKSLFNGLELFSKPKSIDFSQLLIDIATLKDDIVLDFFAGSSTTAHAIMKTNTENNKNLKFIMVQLPEILDVNNASTAEGKKVIQNGIDFCNQNNLPPNIAEISKERIRRAGAKIKADNPNVDTGFKVFKLAESNFKDWDNVDSDDLENQLEMFINPLVDDYDETNVIYELLLKMGLNLNAKIEHKDGVYWLIDNQKSYVIILNEMSDTQFYEIIHQKPTKTIAFDKIFKDDSQKKNIELQFKDAGLAFETI